MCNHEIWCPYCGQDQRRAGSSCCDKQREVVDAETEKKREIAETLDIFGDSLYAPEVGDDDVY
jgi:hypothetical protein